MTKRRLTIATRGSKLALWQAHHVRDRLLATDSELDIELLELVTRGDKILDQPLAKIGGKALFVKEIEQAIIDGRAHIAVHSMKDVPAELAEGLSLAAISVREEPRDALCTRDGGGLDSVPRGGTVGTSSLRRACQLLRVRPDVSIEPLRGNVPTRVGKLDEGQFDAIILAAAGLMRLGLGDRISELFETEMMLPAVGQGVLGIETRTEDTETAELCKRALHHEKDAARVRAERAFLAGVNGGCQTPIGGYADYVGDELRLRVLIGRPDASEILETEVRGAPDSAEQLGIDAAKELLARGADVILTETAEANR